MSTPPSPARQLIVQRARSVPATSWIGLGAAIILAGIGALSGGFWLMLFMFALVVLLTVAYGLIFRRVTWLRLPQKRAVTGVAAIVAFAVLLGSAGAYGAGHPSSPVAPDRAVSATTSPTAASFAETKKTHTPTPTPTPVVTTKLVTETVSIPFPSTTVSSASLPQGSSSVTTAGANGVETKTYTVTYTDGVETARTLQSDVVTQQPVTQVTTLGTYVNSAGNTVCRPEVSSTAPSGATARCVDGTYSFSQSRRGTCSSHGGVAAWL